MIHVDQRFPTWGTEEISRGTPDIFNQLSYYEKKQIY